jgi:hypothetical protein
MALTPKCLPSIIEYLFQRRSIGDHFIYQVRKFPTRLDFREIVPFNDVLLVGMPSEIRRATARACSSSMELVGYVRRQIALQARGNRPP